jgi:DNA topoisomerase-2
VVTDAFVEKVAKLGVVDLALSLTEAKEARMAARKTDGAKTRTVRGIANFIDATSSGTNKSHECWLVLCEGLSAMSGIVSGLSSADRQTIGIYPLKGKLLNVRGESAKRISENKEITDIKKILGLEAGKVYKDADDIRASLRYGKVLLMTDQDVDGSHIKGLCINLFHSEWTSLLHIPGFLAFMNTPILRARRGGQTKVFYHEGEYAAWKEAVGFAEANKWTVKYFKGLGTSTAAEFKEYFANKKVVDLVFADSTSSSSSTSLVSSGDVIDKVFHKKRAEDRKTWLESYDRTVYVDTTLPQITYTDFVDKELIHFSTYDNRRSIPSLVDGLKPSQRKILYGAFVSGLEKKEQKVSEFSGYVSGNVAYHHGEASLNGAIVNMAQTFVGANNVPLLEPHGQFGTRMHGGDDSASERYIFTQLDPMARLLFPADDDPVLTYLDDDGKRVEPDFFVPILPLVLVNGVQGIGTGFSTTIPPFHPRQLVETLRERLQEGQEGQQGQQGSEWQPFYAGFRGRVETLVAGQKWLLRGTYRRVDDAKVEIHELPVGTWTMPYLTFLDGLCDATTNEKTGVKTPALLKSFQDASTDCTVHITVVFNTHVDLDLLQQNMDTQGINGLEKALKLTTTVSLSNVHLFDPCCRLRRYTSVEDIVEAFVPLRLALYQKRKAYQVAALEAQLVKLENKARFVLACLEGVLDLRRKTSGEVDTLLLSHGFDRDSGDFKYLTKMPMDAVTEENVAKTIKEKEEATAALFLLRNTSETDMWLRELELFDTEYGARLSAMGKTKATQVVTTAPAAKKRKSSS